MTLHGLEKIQNKFKLVSSVVLNSAGWNMLLQLYSHNIKPFSDAVMECVTVLK